MHNLQSKLEEAWNANGFRKINYLTLESDLRAVLRAFARGELSADEALSLLDDFIAAHTRRGNEIPREA